MRFHLKEGRILHGNYLPIITNCNFSETFAIDNNRDFVIDSNHCLNVLLRSFSLWTKRVEPLASSGETLHGIHRIPEPALARIAQAAG
jgi:hypothetical protein